MSENQWDKVVEKLDTSKENTWKMYAVDNIHIAWPVLLRKIKGKLKKDSKILDYGCGTGGFCNKLAKEGYISLGIDSSNGMIKLAKNNSTKNSNFLFGDEKALKNLNEKF